MVAFTAPAAAQDGDWTLPRTPDGQPDLQGVWANNNATPLERPPEWAGKERLTDEELAELRAAAALAVDDGDALFGDQLVLAAIERTKATSYDPTTGNYNQFWIVERDFNDRTSLVVDPPDGRIPALTASARDRQAMLRAHRRDHPADSYTDRPLSERCVTYGVPRLGAGYNSYYQIFQSPDHVVVYHEMNHDARVIPIDGTPPLDDDVRLWHGDSRGYWEGDTLVVETANYSSQATFRGLSSEHLRVTERFTRVGAADAELRGHHRRSDDLHAALDRADSADGHDRRHLRVRLPRGQHRHGRHSRGPSGRGTGGGRRGEVAVRAPAAIAAGRFLAPAAGQPPADASAFDFTGRTRRFRGRRFRPGSRLRRGGRRKAEDPS